MSSGFNYHLWYNNIMIKLEIININESNKLIVKKEDNLAFNELKIKILELSNQSSLEKEAEIVNLKLHYYLELFNEGFNFEQLIEIINKHITNTYYNIMIEELKIIEAAYQLYEQENRHKLKKGKL